jgi:hypothetical protein
MIGRGTSRLDNVNVFTTDVFVNLYEGLTIRECSDTYVGERAVETNCDVGSECMVSCTGKEFHAEIRGHL